MGELPETADPASPRGTIRRHNFAVLIVAFPLALLYLFGAFQYFFWFAETGPHPGGAQLLVYVIAFPFLDIVHLMGYEIQSAMATGAFVLNAILWGCLLSLLIVRLVRRFRK